MDLGFHSPLPGSHWVRAWGGERGRLSSCLWNLAFFSERCTEKLPLRVDFIHRVEFGEVSGHRVLIKRRKISAEHVGFGNRASVSHRAWTEVLLCKSTKDVFLCGTKVGQIYSQLSL